MSNGSILSAVFGRGLLILGLVLPLSARPAAAAIFNVSNTAQLISAINTANSNAQNDTINMTTGTYTLTVVNNSYNGAIGLPVIVEFGTMITINGNNSVISRSLAAPNFRIFYVETFAGLTLNNLTIENGRTNSTMGFSSGGGIYSDGDLRLADCVIRNNTAAAALEGELDGGGIASGTTLIGSSVSFQAVRCTFSGNTCSNTLGLGVGGGLTIYAGNANTHLIEDCTFSGNTVSGTAVSIIPIGDPIGGGYGGGAALIESAVARRCTFQGNSAAGVGGSDAGGGGLVLSSLSFAPFVQNCTISGNTTVNGAGLASAGIGVIGTAFINHCTITNNTPGTATTRIGGIVGFIDYPIAPDPQLSHTIIGPHSHPNFGPVAASGTSDGYNISSDTSMSGFLTDTGDQNGVNPMLGALQNNGGPTQTHALLAGSPAIDAGDPVSSLTEDQRGQLRPIGGRVDIGAFERVPPPNGVRRWNIFE